MSYKCLAFAGQEDFLSNTVHLSNVGSMLGQRRRSWPNIKTALDQCLVWVVSCNQFSGYINLYSIGYCWPTLDRSRHARFEAEWFFNNSLNKLICEQTCNKHVNRHVTITLLCKVTLKTPYCPNSQRYTFRSGNGFTLKVYWSVNLNTCL